MHAIFWFKAQTKMVADDVRQAMILFKERGCYGQSSRDGFVKVTHMEAHCCSDS